MQVLGVDHIYITVSDFDRSLAYYDRVMALLDFRKSHSTIAGDPHAHAGRPPELALQAAHQRGDGLHRPLVVLARRRPPIARMAEGAGAP